MSRGALAVVGVIGLVAAVMTWRNVRAPAPGGTSAVSVPSAGAALSPSAGSVAESAAARCEWDPPSSAELQDMMSGVGPPDEAYARDRCVAHEAYAYELEIDSTIVGSTMLGRSNTVGRIPLQWVFGSRPREGHWEGIGTLTSSTTPLGAPTCPPAIPTVDGFGVYDFQVPWVQISTDPTAIEVWVDAGPVVEAFDSLRLPACLGGGLSPTNFWENQFFLTHFKDRGAHGLQIDGWSGSIGGPATGGMVMAVTPETCQGMCGGTSTFTLRMTRRVTP